MLGALASVSQEVVRDSSANYARLEIRALIVIAILGVVAAERTIYSNLPAQRMRNESPHKVKIVFAIIVGLAALCRYLVAAMPPGVCAGVAVVLMIAFTAYERNRMWK